MLWFYKSFTMNFYCPPHSISALELEHILQVTPNLYGNLVSNTAAGIAGGTGVMPGGMYIL